MRVATNEILHISRNFVDFIRLLSFGEFSNRKHVVLIMIIPPLNWRQKMLCVLSWERIGISILILFSDINQLPYQQSIKKPIEIWRCMNIEYIFFLHWHSKNIINEQETYYRVVSIVCFTKQTDQMQCKADAKCAHLLLILKRCARTHTHARQYTQK